MEFPIELKAFKKFFSQANKFHKINPRISYYCRLYALTKILSQADQGVLPNPRDPNIKRVVDDTLAKLETDKTSLEPLNSESDFQAILKVADQEFANADVQDKHGETGVETSQGFMTSLVLYEVLEVFPEKNVKADSKIQKKLKHARRRAVDLSKHVKQEKRTSFSSTNEEVGEFKGGESTDGERSSRGKVCGSFSIGF
jgi:vacuolar protein sorting-associated protein VTA1